MTGADTVERLDSERDLVDRARDDRAAFAELYRAHVDAVHAFATRTSGSRDAADEVTSATFERALHALPSFEWRSGGIRPWLFRIAANEVTNLHRVRSRTTGERAQHAATAALDLHAPDDIVDEPARAALIAAIHQVLPALRPAYRDAITLRYLGSMSAADAAIAIGCSKATLAVTLHRALGALRTALAQHERGVRT